MQAQTPHWVSSWAAAPCAPIARDRRSEQFTLDAETIRQMVHLSSGGTKVRLKFSNEFGTTPLKLSSVHIAEKGAGSSVKQETDVQATVAGRSEFTIASGRSVQTDPVDFPAHDGADIAVSLYVPGSVMAPAVHYAGLQTSYTTAGNQANAPTWTSAKTTTVRMILTAVDVYSATSPGTIIAIGSSTTDGVHSTLNANRRWPDDLYARLHDRLASKAPAVINEGISANRVLHDGRGNSGGAPGEAAVHRFKRDVLEQAGGQSVIAFEGGNDIRMPGNGAIPLSDTVSAQQLIAGFESMARQAHQHQLKFFVGTITAFQDADPNQDRFPAWEATRLAFNEWARHTKEIDGVLDFDAAIRDPENPARLLPRYDSGDHLHPNDAGYQAMADSIDLSLFQ
jgi:lysophospholipase L1-like esterase